MELYDKYMGKYYRTVRTLPTKRVVKNNKTLKEHSFIPTKLLMLNMNWLDFKEFNIVEAILYVTVIIMTTSLFSIVLVLPDALDKLHTTRTVISEVSSQFRIESNELWQELLEFNNGRKKRSLTLEEIKILAAKSTLNRRVFKNDKNDHGTKQWHKIPNRSGSTKNKVVSQNSFKSTKNRLSKEVSTQGSRTITAFNKDGDKLSVGQLSDARQAKKSLENNKVKTLQKNNTNFRKTFQNAISVKKGTNDAIFDKKPLNNTSLPKNAVRRKQINKNHVHSHKNQIHNFGPQIIDSKHLHILNMPSSVKDNTPKKQYLHHQSDNEVSYKARHPRNYKLLNTGSAYPKSARPRQNGVLNINDEYSDIIDAFSNSDDNADAKTQNVINDDIFETSDFTLASKDEYTEPKMNLATDDSGFNNFSTKFSNNDNSSINSKSTPNEPRNYGNDTNFIKPFENTSKNKNVFKNSNKNDLQRTTVPYNVVDILNQHEEEEELPKYQFDTGLEPLPTPENKNDSSTEKIVTLESVPVPLGYIPFPFQKFNFLGNEDLSDSDKPTSTTEKSDLLEDNASVDSFNEDIFDEKQAATALEHLIRVNTIEAHNKHIFPDKVDQYLHPGGPSTVAPEPLESSIIENASFGMEMTVEECQGPLGDPGDLGEDGYDGINGPDGAPGADMSLEYIEDEDGCQVCPTGPPGFVGKEGDMGKQGIPGFPGPPGFVGLDGNSSDCTGPIGPAGDPGLPGNNGPVGSPGDDVMSGIGEPGPEGEEGFIGPRGTVGRPGKPTVFLPGLPGKQGLQGPPGRNGSPGQGGVVGVAGEPGNDASYCPCPRHPGLNPNSAKKPYKYSLTPLSQGNPFGIVSSEPLIPKKKVPWIKDKVKKFKSALNPKAF